MVPPTHFMLFRMRSDVPRSSGTHRNEADMGYSQGDHLAARIRARNLHGEVLVRRLVVRGVDAIILRVEWPVIQDVAERSEVGAQILRRRVARCGIAGNYRDHYGDFLGASERVLRAKTRE